MKISREGFSSILFLPVVSFITRAFHIQRSFSKLFVIKINKVCVGCRFYSFLFILFIYVSLLSHTSFIFFCFIFHFQLFLFLHSEISEILTLIKKVESVRIRILLIYNTLATIHSSPRFQICDPCLDLKRMKRF